MTTAKEPMPPLSKADAINVVLNTSLTKRLIKEAAVYHSTAKARGLPMNDSHYKLRQNWQTVAKKTLCQADVLNVFPNETKLSSEHDENGEFMGTDIIQLSVKKPNDEATDEFADRIDEYFHTWHQIGQGVPFQWTEQTLDMAMKMPLPAHTISRELMMLPYMLFIFEKPIYFNEGPKRRFLTWMALSLDKVEEGRPMHEEGYPMSINYTIDSRDLDYHRDYVNAEGMCNEVHTIKDAQDMSWSSKDACKFPKYRLLEPVSEEQDYLQYAWIKLGGEYPTDYTDEDYVGPPEQREMNQFMADLIVRLLNFINTTAVDIESKGLPRGIKRDKSIRKSESNAYVNVIKLRRVKYRGEYVPVGDGTGRTIEFKGAFWVQGHYKRQAYGLGNTLRKIIYIDPYIKGEGIQRQQLYKVVR